MHFEEVITVVTKCLNRWKRQQLVLCGVKCFLKSSLARLYEGKKLLPILGKLGQDNIVYAFTQQYYPICIPIHTFGGCFCFCMHFVMFFFCTCCECSKTLFMSRMRKEHLVGLASMSLIASRCTTTSGRPSAVFVAPSSGESSDRASSVMVRRGGMVWKRVWLRRDVRLFFF